MVREALDYRPPPRPAHGKGRRFRIARLVMTKGHRGKQTLGDYLRYAGSTCRSERLFQNGLCLGAGHLSVSVSFCFQLPTNLG
jgi:hypothetical protein